MKDEEEEKTLANNRIPDGVLRGIFPKKLNRSPSTEQIYGYLRKLILSGKLKKGQRLLQEEIAEDFRVSRVTVGIAFSQLKKDGLVVCKKGVGPFVVLPGRKSGRGKANGKMGGGSSL